MSVVRAIVAAVLASAACDGEGDPLLGARFVFDIRIVDHSDAGYLVTIDGIPIPSSPAWSGRRLGFETYSEARDRPAVIETWRDGMVVDTCYLYAGACRDACEPLRETSSVCIDGAGAILLNTWDCPCDGGIADWFCGGSCTDTTPRTR